VVITNIEYGRAYQTDFKLTVRFLLSKGAPKDSAEEAAQAAWSKGWEQIGRLRKREHLRTWVNTIALNFFRRSLRYDRRNGPLVDQSGAHSINIAAIDLPILLKLCGSSDRVLLIGQLHGLTTSEMARRVGVTEGAMRVRLTRARRAARILAGNELRSRAA
jgi:RNA polymerase sigma-70 factor (ECF subfamily)